MATIADIARKAGVSEMTVSNVLRGKIKGVRTDAVQRAKRIRKIAADLGYRPNTAARQMRSQKFGAVAVVSRPTIGLFHFNVVKGLIRGLEPHDIHVIQTELDLPGKDQDQATPRLMREFCADGIVVDDAADIPFEIFDRVDSLHMPVVWINTAGDHDCVDPDDEDAAERLTRAVLQAGHRNIAYVGLPHSHPFNHYSASSRRDGVRTAASAAGVEVMELSTDRATSIENAVGLLREYPDATAWIFSSEHDAERMVLAAEREGRSIPGDLSVVTFVNARYSERAAVLITAMGNPFLQVGLTAAEMIVEKIDHPLRKLPVKLVPWDGPTGQTLGSPRP